MKESFDFKKKGIAGFRKFHLLVLALMLLSAQAWSSTLQNAQVTGVVTDVNNEPLIGATVRVAGGTTGTITDFDGKFMLQVPALDVKLEFSYIGYETQIIPLKGRNTLMVKLAEEQTVLEEVVVVAYGVQKKESVVGSIAQVGGDDIVQSGVSNVTSAIAGKISGVSTIQTSGQPGKNDSEILIRGVSSWNGSGPLVLVDGVERDFSDMDPNEIETFSVLKDASATAVFGSKGANGVILVTTKRGKTGAPKLSVSASYGLSQPSVDIDHIDSYTTMSMRNEGAMNNAEFSKLLSSYQLNKYKNPITAVDKVRYPDVNWMDLLTNDFASETNVNLNLNGGTEKVKYFVSLGYLNEGSLFKSYKDNMIDTSFKHDRLNYRVNLDFSLTESTNLKFNLGGNTSFVTTPDSNNSLGIGSQGYLWEAIFTQSTAKYPAYYPAELLEEVPDPDYPDASGIRLIQGPETRNSPYSLLNMGKFTQTTTSKLYTDLILNQDLGMLLKGLSAGAKVSVSTQYANTSLTANRNLPLYVFDFEKYDAGLNPWIRQDAQNDDIYEQPELNVQTGGMGGFYLNLYYEASLNYNRNFGDHYVTALALFNRYQKQSGVDFPYYNENWAVRGTYDYKHKYLFEVNLGYTGSEKFAPGKRFGFFPSFALGYTISNEKWFQEALPWFNKLKFRYSDGKVGSDNGERWLYINEFITQGNLIYESAAANLGAMWEESHKRDIGVEMGFLNNSLTFNVEFFDDQRSNMLVDPQKQLPLILGGNGYKEVNMGRMKKHGVEIEGRYRGKTSFGLNYSAFGMFGFNENRVIAKDDIKLAPDYQKIAGKAHGSQITGTVLTGTGYFTSVDDIHNYVRPKTSQLSDMMPGSYRYIDYNGDGAIDENDRYPIHGSQYAPINYSFGLDLSYKNFTFNFVFQGNSGKYVKFGGPFLNEFNSDDYKVQSTMLDYWTPTNQDATHCAMRTQSGKNNHGVIDGVTWQRADYLKLRDVYIGYRFDTKTLKRYLGISNLTVYATGNNLFTFTDLIYGDPESKSYENGGYPQMRTVKFGLKLGF